MRQGVMRCVSRAMALVMGVVLVCTWLSPTPPAAALDVYITPGTHHVNGRTWRTACSAYSSTVTRCRTEIIATTVAARGNSFVSTTGWTFNNLTYRASPRGPWAGNPLATPGEHTLDGRAWRTECDTAVTGRNGCRSWIRASVVDVASTNPTRYGWKTMWVFNNMVRFTPASGSPAPVIPVAPTKACVGAPIPSGFDVLDNGMPSSPQTGQQPAGAFNPQYIGNFIRQVLKDTRSTASQKKCLAATAAGHLVAHSTTRVVDGVTSRWFPFDFDYSANPSVPTLRAPWHSGLAQANILTLTVLLEDVTGDPVWARYGRETFESFMVPTSAGGFMSREKGFLWFEEYPTTPGTTVLNGNFEALIALSYWGKTMNEPRATAMVTETVPELRPLLEASEVQVEAGLLSSYDLVRGYPAAPLRLLATSGDFWWGTSRLNTTFQSIPTVAAAAPPPPNVLRNSDMSQVTNGVPANWSPLNARSAISASGGALRLVTDGAAWQGAVQSVQAGTFTPEEPLTLAVRSRLTLPTGAPGTSGKIMAYERCSGKYRVLHTTSKLRSTSWASYNVGFPAPRAGCSLEIRLTSGNKGPANTVVEFDDVRLSRAEVIGESVTPAYDMLVDRTPVNTLSLTGAGSATLQAHADGRWQDVAEVRLTPGSSSGAVIPERFTGRNLHYGYHESHVVELLQLYRLTQEVVFLDFARRWAPLASENNGVLPPQQAIKPATALETTGQPDPAKDGQEPK
ncbi:D-glucuronyl C5-epimerase family protein [Tessaracoccus antarcticus]|uniref:D-glucuronyl C5-epimerase C-terminal domain-containing protein n=1 Tax=Tessaracoccus antarcticus TaxID=2479848 RepID=A0A3M0G577_9ACTN|nr:D-glucuronyl C5-epimerase family protein [Tessaracoccus antarcticus]RMB60025.1 hypothetical protein EAX62_09940 [Tessaracoccus antarcticus]